jgi:Glycosyltransferase family 87
MTLQLTRTPRGGGSPARGAAAAPLAVLRRPWVAAVFVACALFAGGVAVFSANPPQRLWGMFAAGAYCAAAVAVAVWRRHGMRLALLIALGGALLAPLAWMAVTGMGQPEIAVIIRSAALLVHHGTPYQGTAALAAAQNVYAYNPYLPALAVFGLPHAIFGSGLLADPRLWFGAVFVTAFGCALSVGSVPHAWRWTILITASPLIAFPLSTGGDDLPVLALMCLGLALLGSGPHGSRPVAAGLVLGLTAAMKATAWPALAVALALVAARDGKRGAARFAVSALAMAAAADGLVLAKQPGAVVVNTILFPLGLTKVKSPAASMLPGHLIAQAWGGGHWVAIALVVISGLAVAGSLLARPPRDELAAGWRLVAGLTLMFTFAPASRVGYFVYPLGLVMWLLLASRATSSRKTAPGPLSRILSGQFARRKVVLSPGSSPEPAPSPVPAQRSGPAHASGNGGHGCGLVRRLRSPKARTPSVTSANSCSGRPTTASRRRG